MTPGAERELLPAITRDLSAALQAGITFAPLATGPPGTLDVQAANAYTGKATIYRLTVGSWYYYPREGKQPTKAQQALIDPVLRTVALYSIDPARFAYLARPDVIAANAPPPPPEPKPAPVRKQKSGGWGLVAAGYAFAPFLFIGSLLFQTAKHYK